MTDHYLLMTATPHKGDPENFCLFLELLVALSHRYCAHACNSCINPDRQPA